MNTGRPCGRMIRLLGLLTAILLATNCGGGSSLAPTPPAPPALSIESVTATPDECPEQDMGAITLTADVSVTPDAIVWRQLGGPPVGLTPGAGNSATVDVSSLQVAVDTELVFEVQVTRGAEIATESVTVVVRAADLTVVPGPHMQIGGSTKSSAVYEVGSMRWALYNVGNRLSATPINVPDGPEFDVTLPAYIHDIAVVEWDGHDYAILALGPEGIAVVDIANPMTMVHLTTVRVNFFQDGLSFTEGGGDILVDQAITSGHAPIVDLDTDGVTLWLADHGYGLHRTALANLMDPSGPITEPDGTLLIDHEAFTLLYAGEQPWGRPHRMTRVGDRLFVAIGFLGLGIYDSWTFERVGAYNMYMDTSVEEDWFVDMEVANEVQPGFQDALTGMPDFNQASFEIQEVWKNDVDAPTPWADFDRYGKYYYHARDVDVGVFPGRSIAYIAYGLGGLVAVDVTGFETADSGGNFVEGAYLGNAPAVPAHGPDKPSGEQSESLYPYFGAGMLKEAGVVGVEVVEDLLFFTDHFAGLVALHHASTPDTHWHGASAPYDNDDPSLGDGVLGDHWPDYEFVTSYDMAPYDPLDHESLPVWMYEAPSVLVTGEVGGHGNSFGMLSPMDLTSPGGVDLLLNVGAGGLNFVDIHGFGAPAMTDRFTLVANYPSTDEIGAAEDGSPTQSIAIGHTQGITASAQYLYVGDGPHGVTAWRIAEADGTPIDDVHLVANTLQDEYQIEVAVEIIYPAPHAWGVVFDEATDSVFTLCQSVGLRRVPVAGVESGLGAVGAPLLLKPQPTDLFEHNGEWGTVDGLQWQDHAYDAVIRGSLAYVADGSNGLTIYDTSKDPTVMTSGFMRANIGGGSTKPPLGRATGITLWDDPDTGKTYAFLACGPRGVGVVDVTDLDDLQYVKVFEPIKMEGDKVGHADGRAVDVHAARGHAFFSYSSFGIVAYSIADLIEPAPEGIDPLEIWQRGDEALIYDYRPEAVALFELETVPGYEHVDGEALYMEFADVGGRLTFYVAMGPAGLVRIDWSVPAAPVLLGMQSSVHEATSVALANGRVYVADHDGGILICR